jgi:porphobilinogen synthase
VRETHLLPAQLVLPIFIREDTSIPPDIGSLPGIRRYTPKEAAARALAWSRAGLGGALLFGVPRRKDAGGTRAWSSAGPVPRALEAMRKAAPDLVLFADVCLCGYTIHGHCGVLRGREVDNDATLPALARTAVAYAEAGADVVAPSAMMDGQVAALRAALDGAGRSETGILAYAAKFASSFYGPFREAARSAPSFGDRRGYQLDPANSREALREIDLDVAQGADMIMVKPALPYLDILRAARRRVSLPLAAFCVSGEYAMIEAAAARGWLDRQSAVLEALTAVRRSGADLVLTYHAEEAARWLNAAK